MRKLKLQIQLSVDGFIAGPQNEMDWMCWNWDNGLKEYTNALHQTVDTLIMGRSFAQGFIPHWQGIAQDPQNPEYAFAQKMVSLRKVLFSKGAGAELSGPSPDQDWAHTEWSKAPLVSGVQALKQETGGDIIAYGGSQFASSLIKDGLVDDYYLFVNPVALGNGLPVFQQLNQYLKLKLESARSFSCGIAVLHYQPA